jgi:type IV pilus assembly protein PilA
MKNAQKGFTLIELMIVVAIIAILAAIAIPQYQTYVVKSQVSRVMGEAGDLKVVVEDCINNGKTTMAAANATPGPLECATTATTSDLIDVASVNGDAVGVPAITLPATAAANTIITAPFGTHASNALSGVTLTWTRTPAGTWTCGLTGGTNIGKYAPVSCPAS